MNHSPRISVTTVPATVLAAVIAALLWFGLRAAISVDGSELTKMVPVWGFVIGGAAFLWVHELIHYAAARVFGNRPSIKIGLLTWQCRFELPMTRNAYLAYSLAPGAFLFLSGIVAMLATASDTVQHLGIIIAIAGLSSGSGDYMLAWKASKLLRTAHVVDHGLHLDVVDKQTVESRV